MRGSAYFTHQLNMNSFSPCSVKINLNHVSSLDFLFFYAPSSGHTNSCAQSEACEHLHLQKKISHRSPIVLKDAFQHNCKSPAVRNTWVSCGSVCDKSQVTWFCTATGGHISTTAWREAGGGANVSEVGGAQDPG